MLSASEFREEIKSLLALIPIGFDMEDAATRDRIFSVFNHKPTYAKERKWQGQLFRHLDLKQLLVVRINTTFNPKATTWNAIVMKAITDTAVIATQGRLNPKDLVPRISGVRSEDVCDRIKDFYLNFCINLNAEDTAKLLTTTKYQTLLVAQGDYGYELLFLLPDPTSFPKAPASNISHYYVTLLNHLRLTQTLDDCSSFQKHTLTPFINILIAAQANLSKHSPTFTPKEVKQIQANLLELAHLIPYTISNNKFGVDLSGKSSLTVKSSLHAVTPKSHTAQLQQEVLIYEVFHAITANKTATIEFIPHPALLTTKDLWRRNHASNFSTALTEVLKFACSMLQFLNPGGTFKPANQIQFITPLLQTFFRFREPICISLLDTLTKSIPAGQHNEILRLCARTPSILEEINRAVKLTTIEGPFLYKHLLNWLGSYPPLDHGGCIALFYALHARSSDGFKLESKKHFATVLSRYQGRMEGLPKALIQRILDAGSTHHELAYFEGVIAGLPV